MSEFTEIKIKVKLTDNGNAVINNEDGICTEIEDGNDFYRILPLIKNKLANGIKTSASGLHIACVSVLLFDFWVHIKCGMNDTPKKEVEQGVANFLANYKR
jgi:hypothetical protein